MPPSPFKPNFRYDDGSKSTVAAFRSRRAIRLVIRGLLFKLSYLGGSATGGSVMVLLLYRPIDWRWGWIGIGGIAAGALATWLIAYFPKPGRETP